MKLSGTKPAIFQLVAQCLNQLLYRVPPLIRGSVRKLVQNAFLIVICNKNSLHLTVLLLTLHLHINTHHSWDIQGEHKVFP